LESQLQEAKQYTDTLQVQLKALSAVDRMKRSHEQFTAQKQIHMLQIKVMEVTQWLQPTKDKACLLFIEVESQGVELEQVVLTTEQCLEGPVNDVVIQEFTEQEATTKQQVEVARAKLEVFEAELLRPEWLEDESKVSFGSLLALDQVLGIFWPWWPILELR
jgi:hypothetical protein